MLIHRAAKRYAHVLYDLAGDAGQTDAINDVMTSLHSILSANADLSGFLKNYTLSSSKRMEILSALFEKKCGGLFWKFLRFLESKRRTGLLDHIAISYSQIYMKENGIVDAVIKTPFALDAAQQTLVRTHLEKKLAAKVSLSAGMDTSLIGGFTILMDWNLFDLSVSGMLESLRRNAVAP